VTARSVKTGGDGSGNATDKIAAFMSRVVPWPADNGGSGFINIHWNLPGKTFEGRCVRDVEDMLTAAEQISTVFKQNAYYCLSRQSVNGGTRNAKNAIDLKSVWMDIDVKENNPKAYQSLDDALLALTGFIERFKLPDPTTYVRSGGGLHVYWISDRPLPVDTWRRYARGLRVLATEYDLRADLALTTDPARVLRVPGTLNYKTQFPRPVGIIRQNPDDYDFGAELKLLWERGVEEGRSATGGQPFGALGSVGEAFRVEGVEVEDFGIFTTITAEDLAHVCPWIKTALETGGKDYDQPQWNLTTLCATFLEDGNEAAHQFGCEHEGYTEPSTEALWRRKLKEKLERDLGPPRCESIQAAGSTACARCPLFARKSSPIQLAREAKDEAQLALPSPTIDVAAISRQVKEGKLNPVTALMTLRGQGAGINALLEAMNENYAVVKHGAHTVVATITGDDICFMNVEDFHKMFANLVFGPKRIKVSKRWFEWTGRRQYLGRGVVFEPGRPLEIQNDMLNLWRGFGVVPKSGDWSLMHAHIFNVLCSGDQQLCDYLIKWMAYAVQHPDKPIDVAVALLGPRGR
jgi:hypothetical protein